MRAETAVFSLAAVVYILALAACPINFARTIRVANDGSADYTTIQAAIDASVDGDTVLVAPSTYTGHGNRDIDFNRKAITVRSENGPRTCIIKCEASRNDCHRGFYFHSGEDANAVVQGFTVTGGYTSDSYAELHPYGGGIYCNNASPRIADCIVTGNVAPWGGGGIAMIDSNSVMIGCVVSNNVTNSTGMGLGYGGGGSICNGHPRLLNCLITGNVSSNGGGGIRCDRSNVTLSNCTICDNRTNGLGGAITCTAGQGNKVIFNDSILWGNESKDGIANQIHLGNTILGAVQLEMNYCVVQGGDESVKAPRGYVVGSWTDIDPQFADPGYWDRNGTTDNRRWDDFWVGGDHHLKSQAGRWDPNSGSWVQDDVTSPCIDAGDPNSPIGDEPFPNGGRINMGAYGGTAEASKSYFGDPVSETIIAGDINGDGKVDWLDLDILASHWLQDVWK